MFVHAVSCALGGEGAGLSLPIKSLQILDSVGSFVTAACCIQECKNGRRGSEERERAEIADRSEGSSFGSGEEQVFYFSMSDAAIPKAAYAESESHGVFKVLITWKDIVILCLRLVSPC